MKVSNTSERLKFYMKEKEVSQAEILRRCKPFCENFHVKMNKSDLSQYVSGKIEPKQDKLYVLSCALDVSQAWLMGLDVDMNADFFEQAAIEDATLVSKFRQLPGELQMNILSIMDNYFYSPYLSDEQDPIQQNTSHTSDNT